MTFDEDGMTVLEKVTTTVSNGVEGYVHPKHRSLHAPLLVLAVFAIFLASSSLLSTPAYAKDEQADAQCPAGGVVGQTCKDNTNGYTTAGHCTHIQICAADNWPKAPRGCQPGQVAGQDCPYGPNPTTGPGFTPQPFPISTSSSVSAPAQGISAGDIFGAFGGNSVTGGASPAQKTIVGSTSIEGIQYLITGENEELKVGEPLTPAPPPIELHLGNTFSLDPARNTQGGVENLSSAAGYPRGTSFGTVQTTGTFGAASSSNGGGIVGSLMQSLVMLFSGQHPADELIIGSAVPAIIMPDISLYYQAQALESAHLVDPGWEDLQESDVSARPSILTLVRAALTHTGRAALELLSADLTGAHVDIAKAAVESGAALHGVGESLSDSLSGVFSKFAH